VRLLSDSRDAITGDRFFTDSGDIGWCNFEPHCEWFSLLEFRYSGVDTPAGQFIPEIYFIKSSFWDQFGWSLYFGYILDANRSFDVKYPSVLLIYQDSSLMPPAAWPYPPIHIV